MPPGHLCIAAARCSNALWQLFVAGGGPSIWERILRHKAPVIEPRDSGAFAAAIADYQAKLDDPAGGGAVLFAVCRGKVRGSAVCLCVLLGLLILLCCCHC
jgi:hypothetical protein